MTSLLRNVSSAPRSRLRLWLHALRWPFTGASVLPYIAGAVVSPAPWDGLGFLFGLGMVACCHLSANLANDYADSLEGPDNADLTFYGFFGGSKLIQWGLLERKDYLRGAACFAAAGGVFTGLACWRIGSVWPAAGYLAAGLLGWAYSCPPAKLAFRHGGEAVVFLLFGPAAVVCGSFLQGQWLGLWRAAMLSIPLGLLTAGVLLANEVPDATDDARAGKRTLVGLLGPRGGAVAYLGVNTLAAIGLVLCSALDILGPWGYALVVLVVPSAGGAWWMARHAAKKRLLLVSSRLAVGIQSVAAGATILAALGGSHG